MITHTEEVRTLEELKEIINAEFKYWHADDSAPAIGALGACSNILAALHGWRAPWHPQPITPVQECPRLYAITGFPGWIRSVNECPT